MFGVNKELAVHGSSRVDGTCSEDVRAGIVVHVFVDELGITTRRRTYSVDVHVIGVVVLGVFGLAGPVLAMVVVHVRSERYLMTPTSSRRR